MLPVLLNQSFLHVFNSFFGVQIELLNITIDYLSC